MGSFMHMERHGTLPQLFPECVSKSLPHHRHKQRKNRNHYELFLCRLQAVILANAAKPWKLCLWSNLLVLLCEMDRRGKSSWQITFLLQSLFLGRTPCRAMQPLFSFTSQTPNQLTENTKQINIFSITNLSEILGPNSKALSYASLGKRTKFLTKVVAIMIITH